MTLLPHFLTLLLQVFYSSSNQIGRLIENLSEGHEAGTFNFLPTKDPGHAHSSSINSETDMHWTVEERLDRMLGSMRNP
jgi:serine/arginine repetitive matrix protein 2